MYLIRVGLNATVYDHEAKELTKCYAKGALHRIELHVVPLEYLKGVVEMIDQRGET